MDSDMHNRSTYSVGDAAPSVRMKRVNEESLTVLVGCGYAEAIMKCYGRMNSSKEKQIMVKITPAPNSIHIKKEHTHDMIYFDLAGVIRDLVKALYRYEVVDDWDQKTYTEKNLIDYVDDTLHVLVTAP